MPVRKNIKNAISPTGNRYSTKLGRQVWHESNLEADYLDLLEFDGDVIAFEEQPMTIEFKQGKKSMTHTPDALVVYGGAERKRTVLVQVKYRSKLLSDWKKLHPGLRAAARFAARQGWGFKIVTEREIRTPTLYNVQTLLPFRHQQLDLRQIDLYLGLVERGAQTLGDLMAAAQRKGVSPSDSRATINCLLARRLLQTDLSVIISDKSELFL